MRSPPSIRRLGRIAFALAAAGSGVLLLVALGLWGRSYGRWDEVYYDWGGSGNLCYRLASTDGEIVWWAEWYARDPNDGPVTGNRSYAALCANARYLSNSPSIFDGEKLRYFHSYGRGAYEPWADSRVALAGGRLGFGWASGSTSHQPTEVAGMVPKPYVTRKQTGTAPWWAAVAVLVMGPAAWVVSRRRAGRRVVPRPKVAAWMRRPARVGLFLSSAGCGLVLLVWAFTLFYSCDGGARAFGTDGWVRLIGGGLQAGWSDARAADHPDAPNPPHVSWGWLGWWAWYDLNESDVPSQRGLTVRRWVAWVRVPSVEGRTGIFDEWESGPVRNADGTPVVPRPINYDLTLPLLVPAGLLAIWPLAAGMRRGANRWANRRRRAGRCPACGYDLRASPQRCPECGRPVGGAEPTAGRLPLVAAGSLLLAGGLIYPMVANDRYGSWYDKTLVKWDWQWRPPSEGRPNVTLAMAARQLDLSWKRDAGTTESPFGSERNTTGDQLEVAGFALSREWTAIEHEPPAESEEWDSDQWDAWRASPAATGRGELRGWTASGPAWVVVAALLLPIGWWGWRSARRSVAVAAQSNEAASHAGV